jgi:hypothetical protein
MGAFKARSFFKNPAIYQKSGLNLQNNLIYMRQRNFFMIVVPIFLFCGEIFGQEKNVEKIPPGLTKLIEYSHNQRTEPQLKNVKIPVSGHIVPGGILLKNNFLLSPVSKDFYSNQLSFFCRTELKFEKATSIPLRFRLGSLAYTDYLEKKPNARGN